MNKSTGDDVEKKEIVRGFWYVVSLLLALAIGSILSSATGRMEIGFLGLVGWMALTYTLERVGVWGAIRRALNPVLFGIGYAFAVVTWMFRRLVVPIVVFGWFVAVAPAVLGVFALLEQIVDWLRYGSASSRDLHWLLAPQECAATMGSELGWAGKDLCRADFAVVTDWVGVNQLANFVMDGHVLIFAVAVSLCALGLASSFAESLGDWTREYDEDHGRDDRPNLGAG